MSISRGRLTACAARAGLLPDDGCPGGGASLRQASPRLPSQQAHRTGEQKSEHPSRYLDAIAGCSRDPIPEIHGVAIPLPPSVPVPSIVRQAVLQELLRRRPDPRKERIAGVLGREIPELFRVQRGTALEHPGPPGVFAESLWSIPGEKEPAACKAWIRELDEAWVVLQALHAGLQEHAK